MNEKEYPENEIDISRGILLKSVNDYIKTGTAYNQENIDYSVITDIINDENKTDFIHFNDLEEIETPFQPLYDNKTGNSIDNIIYTKADDYKKEITNYIIKNLYTKKTESINDINTRNESDIIEKHIIKNKIHIPVRKTAETQKIEPKENIENVIPLEPETVPDLPDVETGDKNDDTEYLASRINKDNGTVYSPGAIRLENIEPELSDKTVVDDKKQSTEADIFGVNKEEIYQSIDAQINDARKVNHGGLSKFTNIKNGITAPVLAALIPFIFLIVSIPFMSYYFKKASFAALEDNLKTDTSILSKIAKQKEDEARRLKEQLEEELRKISANKGVVEAGLNEELSRKQADIESDYNKKLESYKASSISKNEFAKLKKELDDEKAKALSEAENDKRLKLIEQEKLLSQKNKEIEEAKNIIKNAIDNKDFELEKIKSSLAAQVADRTKEQEEIASKLEQMRQYNDKIKNFNARIYQIISASMDNFKNKEFEAGILKLNNAVDYYNKEKDFVTSTEELRGKMVTDIFFINTISNLVNSAGNSIYYDKEFMNTLNKFKLINDYYNNAEKLYSNMRYPDALKQYMNVLNEFDSINNSYQRVMSIEQEIQNTKALSLYNDAISLMKAGNYSPALTLLVQIIRENPKSGYTQQALDNIVNLAGTLDATQKNKHDDSKAAVLFNDALAFEAANNQKAAMNTYEKIIIDYPGSSYTAKSLQKILLIRAVLGSKDIEAFEDNLRKTFMLNYTEFGKAYKTGDLSNARKHYFGALSAAFSLYTNDSTDEFIKVEDEYIKSLLSSSSADNNAEKLLTTAKADIESKYNEILKAKDEEFARKLSSETAKAEAEKQQIIDKYEAAAAVTDSSKLAALKKEYDDRLEKERADLISKYENMLSEAKGDTSTVEKLQKEYESKLSEKDKLIEDLKKSGSMLSSDELEKQKSLYEKEITAKNEEIAALKKQTSELSPDNNEYLKEAQKSLVEKQQELEEEKKYIQGLQKQLVDAYKKNDELINKADEAVKTSNEQMAKELSDIKDKYKTLEKQSSRSRINEEQLKKQITEEVKQDYEKTVQREKERLQDEFAKALDNIKEYTPTSTGKYNTLSNEFTGDMEYSKAKITARIIEVIDTSVTFQFLSEEAIPTLKVGDGVTVVRLRGGKETEIARLKVTYTSSYSLFGRARITELSQGGKIEISDVIKK